MKNRDNDIFFGEKLNEMYLILNELEIFSKENRYTGYYSKWLKRLRVSISTLYDKLNSNAPSFEKEIKINRAKKELSIRLIQLKQDDRVHKLESEIDSLQDNLKLSYSINESTELMLAERISSISRIGNKLGIQREDYISLNDYEELIFQKLAQIQYLDKIINQKKDFIEIQNKKIANGKTDEVIRNLMDFAKENKDKTLQRRCLNISSRYKTIITKERNNTLNHEAIGIQVAQINDNLINLLTELEEEI